MSEEVRTDHGKGGTPSWKIALFFIVALSWLLFDQITKAYFNTFELGEVISGPYFGLFQFVLLHNTGAAWGIFGEMTTVLAVVSMIICALILIYLFAMRSSLTVLASVALGLVFAGGVGNVIDRFTNSYVTDFIAPIFIDFPVFNIADVGVTCGVVLFIIDLVIEMVRSASHTESSAKEGNFHG